MKVDVTTIPLGAQVWEAAPEGDPEVTHPELRRTGMVIGHTEISTAEGFVVPAVKVLRAGKPDKRTVRGCNVWEETLPLEGLNGPLVVAQPPIVARSADAPLNAIFRSLAVQKSYGTATVRLLFIALELLDAAGWVERYKTAERVS